MQSKHGARLAELEEKLRASESESVVARGEATEGRQRAEKAEERLSEMIASLEALRKQNTDFVRESTELSGRVRGAERESESAAARVAELEAALRAAQGAGDAASAEAQAREARLQRELSERSEVLERQREDARVAQVGAYL
jgi:chromosome segregation ATPase